MAPRRAVAAPAVEVTPVEEGSYHALVGGWVQEHGRFTALLLGIREGRRRKLTFLGRAEVDPAGLLMRFLEPNLRRLEVELPPFVAPPEGGRGETLHWIRPELIAALRSDDGAPRKVWRRNQLATVLERGPLRHPNWLSPFAKDERSSKTRG